MMLRRQLVLGAMALLLGCLPNKNSGEVGGGGTPVLTDANCGSKSVDTCVSTNCEVSSGACVGKASYCSKYAAYDSCPVSSCVWNSSCVPRTPFVPQQTPTDPSTGSQVVNCSTMTQATCSSPNCQWNGNQCVSSSMVPQNGGSPTQPNSGGVPQDPNNYVNPNIEATCSQIGAKFFQCWNTPGCKFYPLALPPNWGCHAAR